MYDGDADSSTPENRHEESTILLEALFNAIPDILGVQKKDHTIVRYNRAGYDFLNLTHDQVKGKKCYELIGRSAPCTECATSRVYETRKSESVIKYVREMDVWLDVRAYPILNREGQILYIIEHLRDITPIKKAEADLTRSNTLLKGLFDNMPAGILVWDGAGQLEHANKTFTEITGYTREDIADIENWFLRAYPDPKFRARVTDDWNEARARGGTAIREFTVTCSDGSVKDIDFRSAFMDDGGSLVSMVDVSERNAAEKERTSLKMQLQQAQKMEALGILTSGITHDFNNILQIISGCTQCLQTQENVSRSQKKYLETIENSVIEASSIIRSLLTFSRKSEPALVMAELNTIISETVSVLKRLLPRSIEIRTELDKNLPCLLVDPIQIRQVLMNLATNAVDAIVDAGCIEITTKKVSEDGTSSPFVRMTFSDSGRGMDEHVQKHIFDPFFTTKERGKGTGLGMSMVYGIVTAHDGKIDCRSRPGYGSTFVIELPARFGESAPETISPSPAAEDCRGKESVLYVDDEKVIREIARKKLSDMGYDVMLAESCEAALELMEVSREAIDLVILDLGMPGMGGEKCIHALRKICPDIRIIVASGYNDHPIAESPHQFGVELFLNKPYSMNSLALAVRSVLDGG